MADPRVHAFSLASRDRYPGFLDGLAARTSLEIAINRLGILEVAHDAEREQTLKRSRQGKWLGAEEVARVEPALRPVAGAMYYESDGSVDNIALMHALDFAVEAEPLIARIDARVTSIAVAPAKNVTVTVSDGSTYSAPQLVLAAGCWVGLIDGLPRPLPVEPLRGQVISVERSPVRTLSPTHVVYGAGGYIVPRANRVLVGATLERAGFEAVTTEAGVGELRKIGEALWKPIPTTAIAASWAGLRPVTPDMLPILGRDSVCHSLIYACGHSRNGILMAPLTADCVAAIAVGDDPPADISPFRADRFEAA